MEQQTAQYGIDAGGLERLTAWLTERQTDAPDQLARDLIASEPMQEILRATAWTAWVDGAGSGYDPAHIDG